MSRHHFETRPSRDPDILIGFLARVGWEVCPSCDGRGGTASREDVFPCGDCGGFCLVEIEDEDEDDEMADGSLVPEVSEETPNA